MFSFSTQFNAHKRFEEQTNKWRRVNTKTTTGIEHISLRAFVSWTRMLREQLHRKIAINLLAIRDDCNLVLYIAWSIVLSAKIWF